MPVQTNHFRKNVITSTLSLFFQSSYSAFLGLLANLVLTILLTPKIFGIYFTILSMISIFNYFSDIGLAASLVQKKEIEESDLKTAFTIQQLLILIIITLGFLLTAFIKNFYNLPREGVYLYWSLLFGFFFSSLKTIPSVLLERKIKFEKIVLVQIVENTIFYLLVIILALFNFGITSFSVAVIFRSITGVILIYSISFWLPKIGISSVSLKKLISFGLPFQMNSFLALIKDDLITLFLGKTLGFTQLGYIGWAKKWAESPLRIIMDNLSRVLFPLFSRFQEDKKKLSTLIEKILYYQTAILFPALVGAAIVMPKIIEILPRYSKWQPALPLFYLFCLSAFFSSYSTPFINLFNGIGKVNISLVFMTLWTISTWILTPILIKFFGLYGFPLTLVILSSSFIMVVFAAKKIIPFSFLKTIYKFIITGGLMGVVVYILLKIPLSPFLSLIIAISGGIISYILLNLVLFKINLLKESRSLLTYEK